MTASDAGQTSHTLQPSAKLALACGMNGYRDVGDGAVDTASTTSFQLSGVSSDFDEDADNDFTALDTVILPSFVFATD